MMRVNFIGLLLASLVLFPFSAGAQDGGMMMREKPLAMGEMAPQGEMMLMSPAGDEVELKDQMGEGPTVLVVLRGNPGYHCPACMGQVADFVSNAKAFSDAGAKVVFIYPGPKDGLMDHTKQFLMSPALAKAAPEAELPEPFSILMDPDYAFTNAYGIRWDQPGETAMPSVFIVQKDGEVAFATTVQEHGGRTPAKEVLAALAKMPMMAPAH